MRPTPAGCPPRRRAGLEFQLRPHPGHHHSRRRIGHQLPGLPGQVRGPGQLTGVGCRRGSQGKPPPPGRRAGRQRGGSFVGGGGGGAAAPAVRPVGGGVQLGGNLLVRAVRQGGQVPGPPVTVQHPGQRPVRRCPFRDIGAGQHRRPGQRMGEDDPRRGHPHQPGPLAGGQVGQRPAGGGDRPADLRQIRQPAQRREQHRPAALLRQPADPGTERLLHPANRRSGGQDQRRHRPGPLRRRQAAGQLDQRQRVPARLGDQLIADRSHQPRPGQQLFRRRLVQPAHPQLRQPRQAGTGRLIPRRRQDRGPLRLQPPSGEHQRIGRRPVHPLRVIGQHQHRPVLR